MQIAYTDGAGRTNPTATELGAGNIGGLSLAPGLYKWGTGVTIPTNVTLAGGANDVWIFQIAQNLTVSSGVHVVLSGGAQASNVFWVVAGQTTLGTGAVFSGTILDQTAIALNTGATLNGRAFAQTAVTLDANSVSLPSYSAAVTSMPPPPPPPTTTPTTTTSPTYTTTSNQTNTSTYPTTTSMPQGQAVVLGNGQTVYLSPNGAFTNAQGQAVSSASIGVSTAPASTVPQIRQVAMDLDLASRGSDVSVLQQFLMSAQAGTAASALSGVGSTGYFGALTKAALAEFQASVGIKPSAGYFGAITRAYIRAHY
jgi:hypothetical protein